MKTLVNQSKLKHTPLPIFVGIFLLIVIICIAINPAKYSTVAFNGLSVWAKVLVPSLLPFFILTKLLASTGIIDEICKIFAPLINKLYACPKQSAYVFFMSIITGYPVGSKLIADLYNNQQITKHQAIKTASFCSTSGPMFILGTVAIGMFANKKMGYIILISHILGALINGLIYRNIGKVKKHNLKTSNNKNQEVENIKPIPKIKFDFSQNVISSVNSILLIGGVVCFTFVLLELIISNPIFNGFCTFLGNLGLNPSIFISIFCGLGEITKGCILLSSCPLSHQLASILATFLISFGGISTFLQAYAFLKGIVPSKMFLLQKFTHAVCSCIVCILLVLIF